MAYARVNFKKKQRNQRNKFLDVSVKNNIVRIVAVKKWDRRSSDFVVVDHSDAVYDELMASEDDVYTPKLLYDSVNLVINEVSEIKASEKNPSISGNVSQKFKLQTYNRYSQPSISGWSPAECKGSKEFKLRIYKRNYRPSISGWCLAQHPICVAPQSNPTSTTSKANEKYKSGSKKGKDVPKLTKPVKKIIAHPFPLVPGLSFMASLAENIPIALCHVDALRYRDTRNLKTFRENLTRYLFTECNRKIFDNALDPCLAIRWSNKFRTTAGTTSYHLGNDSRGNSIRTSSIKLSTEVLDTPLRLRDILVHELCHAATWQVDAVPRARHGPVWQKWAEKAVQVFPELGKVSRHHNLKIYYKYTFECTACGFCIHRHSKSIDIAKTSCGYCHGKFQVIFNKKNKDGSVVSTPCRKRSKFAQLIKDYYALYRFQYKTHAQAMKILSKQFAESKNNPMCDSDYSDDSDEI